MSSISAVPQRKANVNTIDALSMRIDNSEGHEVKAQLQAKCVKLRPSKTAQSFDFSLSDAQSTCCIPLDDILDYIAYLGESDDEELHAIEPEHRFLIQTARTIIQSPTSAALLSEAAKDSWAIEVQDLDDHDFHLDVPEKCITINSRGLGAESLGRSRYFRGAVAASLIRALRDIWQEKRHGGFENNFGPEHILQLERTRAADCETLLILAAWEIERTGAPDLWRHMIGSNEGDMAMAFSAALDEQADQNAVYDAMNAAFKQWFCAAERVNVCDHETLEYLDGLIAEEGKDVFGSVYMMPQDLEILSCLPNRIAYLQGRGAELTRNPLYSGMNDPINQSHFMHIMQDLHTVQVGGLAFRDADLAAKIFPQESRKSTASV